MHERERHRLILRAVEEKPVVTVQELVEITEASEATIRRDIAALHVAGKVRRLRGGVEALAPPQFVGIAGRPFKVAETLHVERKRAIARAAVALCANGDSIIVNGGTTTFQMVHFLAGSRLQVLTNSFPIAEHLVRHSRNVVMVPGGAVYREQGLILSPFDNDVTQNFFAHRMFMGAQGVGRLGVMERDPLLIQAERKLLDRAEKLVVLVDSSKFAQRSSLILCGLDRVDTIVTDDGVDDAVAAMIEEAGVRLVVAEAEAGFDDLKLSESA